MLTMTETMSGIYSNTRHSVAKVTNIPGCLHSMFIMSHSFGSATDLVCYKRVKFSHFAYIHLVVLIFHKICELFFSHSLISYKPNTHLFLFCGFLKPRCLYINISVFFCVLDLPLIILNLKFSLNLTIYFLWKRKIIH